PPLVSAAEPQSFRVYAPGASHVAVRFGPRAKLLDARELGHGLFRADYDPRRDGLPDPPDGELRAELVVDGHAHARSMLAAKPLIHPRALCASSTAAVAAAVSEETDELILIHRDGNT